MICKYLQYGDLLNNIKMDFIISFFLFGDCLIQCSFHLMDLGDDIPSTINLDPYQNAFPYAEYIITSIEPNNIENT